MHLIQAYIRYVLALFVRLFCNVVKTYKNPLDKQKFYSFFYSDLK